MPKYRFTTGRYAPSGERIANQVKTATKGDLSTLRGIRRGRTTKASPVRASIPPKTPKIKKSQAYDTLVTPKDKQRKVFQYKGSVKTYAQLTLGKEVKKSKFGIVPNFGNRAEALKDNVKRFAEQNHAPDWMMRKIEGMDPNALYLLGQVNRSTIEVYFDYGDVVENDVVEEDLFWANKWDDVQFLIDQYERAYGIIESVRW